MIPDRPVTKRAVERNGIHLMKAFSCRSARHVVQLPGGVCPRTNEPAAAEAVVSYVPGDHVLEVESLRRFMLSTWTSAGGVEDAGLAIVGGLKRALRLPVRLQLSVTLQCGSRLHLRW